MEVYTFLSVKGMTAWLMVVTSAILAGCLFSLLQRRLQIHGFKRRHQCQDPPRYAHTDRIWGSDLVHERMTAMREGKYSKLYLKHFAKYGKTFEDKIRGHRTINTIEPRNVQCVLALATEDFMKDSARIKAEKPFLGPSVFSDGPHWKQSRSMVKPIFDRAELSDMDQLASFAERCMELIPNDGSMVDMQSLLQRLFLDVSTDFILGEPVGALNSELSAETTQYFAAFAQAQRWVTKRREAGWMAWRYDYSREWVNAYRTVHSFIDRHVARALRDIKDEATPETDERLEAQAKRKRYVLLHELAKQMRDPIGLRYQVLGVMLPAHDSAARGVALSLFQLARHPHEWAKLRTVALTRVRGHLTYEKLRSLVEFKHVFFETIRTIGPVARVVREAVRDTLMPLGGGPDGRSPCFVPKGTTVSMSTWSMCHDRDTWGDDVEKFKPDRWHGKKIYWDFVPFSGGPRICPAQQQVITHVTYMLYRLTERFEVMENCDPVHEFIEHFLVGPRSKNGVKVAFKKPNTTEK